MNLIAQTITYPGPRATDTTQILSIVFGVLGAIAVIVLILAAIRMILFGGTNPQEVAKTKNTVIYAGVGLAVALLALAIVQLVAGIAS